MARNMTTLAEALGRNEDARKYEDLYGKIRTAFQKEFIKPDGMIGSGSQTSILLALHMKLVPEPLIPTTVSNLVKDIEAHGNHLTTGFLGTPHLLFVLADNGRADVAYRLLLNETYPSWGYMIKNGATTWWERWNSDKGDPAMNSFNHYAFGSVMAWVYRYAAGIDTSTAGPGFKEIIIHPRPNPGLTAARAEYDSVYGKIISDWTTAPNGALTLKVTIPPNTRAKIILPDKTIETGSGTYTYQSK
jgi:alpha-L-rhamnosidase